MPNLYSLQDLDQLKLNLSSELLSKEMEVLNVTTSNMTITREILALRKELEELELLIKLLI
jgi:hypothetical protein